MDQKRDTTLQQGAEKGAEMNPKASDGAMSEPTKETPTALAAGDGNDEEACGRCGCYYDLRDGQEPTPLCDECAHAEVAKMRELLTAAAHALRSYQYGNASPDLAETVAIIIERELSPNTKLSDPSAGSVL